MKNKYLSAFVKGIYAGLAIGLGSFLFVLCSRFSNKALGSFLFGIGLTLVCTLGLFLYTGKIAYITNNKDKKSYSLQLLLGWLGNLVGACALGYLTLLICKLCNFTSMINTANKVASSRFINLGHGGAKSYLTFIKSFFCGICVYLAVNNFKTKSPFIFRLLFLLLNVFIFVYGGFEHCIANMYYISFANAWNVQTIINVLLVTLGNSIGAIVINAI